MHDTNSTSYTLFLLYSSSTLICSLIYEILNSFVNNLFELKESVTQNASEDIKERNKLESSTRLLCLRQI